MSNIQENWKDITGYEGEYQISNFGRVRSLDRIFKKKNQWGTFYQKYKGQIVKGVVHPNGYVRVDLKRKKLYLVHRLVAIAFIGNDDQNKEVNHKDGNKLNNHHSNLEWVTKSENIRHADRTGLRKMPKGKDHFMFGMTGSKHHNFGKKWKKNASM